MRTFSYKAALMLGLRFKTDKGTVTTEDLFSHSLTQLDKAYKTYRKEVKEGAEESLSSAPTKAVREAELKAEIIKDVYDTKVAESNAKRQATKDAQFNATLDNRIAAKLEGQLDEMSIEQLRALKR